MIAENTWNKIANYAKAKMLSSFSGEGILNPDIGEAANYPHVGFYISLENSSGDDFVNEGILHESLRNIIDSTNLVSDSAVTSMKSKDVDQSKIQTSTLNITVVTACTYIKNPLSWDENSDGLCFQWGQQFKGVYLPHQIKKMNSTKLEVLDKLCSWEAGVASSLWRLPEGLIWKLTCESYSL